MAALPGGIPALPRENRVIQLAWVVADLEAAALRWVRTMGVGPFILMEHVVLEDLYHRDAPAPAMDTSFAIAQAGPIQIELVQQHDPGPSAYRDTVPAGREAFHHVAAMCTDYDAECAAYGALGFELAQHGRVGATRFCYVDTTATIGCMVELVEATAVMRDVFARIAAASVGWDGSEPLRRLA